MGAVCSFKPCLFADAFLHAASFPNSLVACGLLDPRVKPEDDDLKIYARFEPKDDGVGIDALASRDDEECGALLLRNLDPTRRYRCVSAK